MVDHPSVHGGRTVSDSDDHDDGGDSNGLGMGRSSHGSGSTSSESSPLERAGSARTSGVIFPRPALGHSIKSS